MAYVSGTLNEDARVIVLDSSNSTVAAGTKTAGGFFIDKFGSTRTEGSEDFTVESGTVIAVSNIGETVAFNKVEFEIVSDLPQTMPWTETFTGTDGLYPKGHMWTRSNVAPAVGLYGNKLRLYVASGSANRSSCVSDFLIWGNFDIQVDLDVVVGGSSTNDWTAQMQIRWEPNVAILSGNSLTSLCDFFAVRRVRYSAGHSFSAAYKIAGTSTSTTPVSTSLTTTKFRIVRNNNSVTGYYWTGSAWSALASNIDFNSAYVGGHSPISVRFDLSNDVNYPTATMDFDNFTINSGYLSYRHIESFNNYSDGSEPDSNFFNPVTGLSTIQGNKLRLATNASVSNSMCVYNFPLKGYFDTLCSFNMVAAPSSGVWHAQFRVNAPDAGNSMNIKRTYNGSVQQITATSYINGSADSDALTSSATSGYFRIRRAPGNTVYLYYSTDAATWTQLHTRSGFSAEDAYVSFYVYYTSGTPSVTCDFDDFKIVNKPFNDLKIKFPTDSVR